MSAELPVHLADQFDAASAEVRAAFEAAGEIAGDRFECGEVTPPPWAEVLAGLHFMCTHVAYGGPQPFAVRWAKRSALCLDCDRAAGVLPDIVGERECERCGAEAERFHETLYQIGPALFCTNVCGACYTAVGAGEPVLLEDRYPREGRL
jgi:hypothetical protein